MLNNADSHGKELRHSVFRCNNRLLLIYSSSMQTNKSRCIDSRSSSGSDKQIIMASPNVNILEPLYMIVLLSLFAENVRVVSGSNRCNGRVEVFHEGQWKRACASDWGRDEAAVICQEIRCGTPIIQTDMPYFGEARHLLGVKTTCSGNETSLSQCTLKDFKETCVDATVFCSSK